MQSLDHIAGGATKSVRCSLFDKGFTVFWGSRILPYACGERKERAKWGLSSCTDSQEHKEVENNVPGLQDSREPWQWHSLKEVFSAPTALTLFFLPFSAESLQEASPRLADHGGSSGGGWEVKRSQRLRRGPSSSRRSYQDMEYERRWVIHSLCAQAL